MLQYYIQKRLLYWSFPATFLIIFMTPSQWFLYDRDLRHEELQIHTMPHEPLT